MTKTILGVLSLLVIMSCSIPVKENTVQPNIMETNKKNLGNLLALYPKPMTVVGAEVEGKVNWLVVGHTGVIGHDRILISMSKSHYTNQGIKDSKRLSVNLVSREILPKADYVGSVSGATVDKSEVFAYHIGENGTPVIDASPLTMECEVVDIYETEGFDNFICAIVNTYAAPEVLDNNGKLDYTKLKPVLFEFPTYSYLATGEIIGKCLNLDKRPGAVVENRGLSAVSRRVYEIRNRSRRNLSAYRIGRADYVCGRREGESLQGDYSRNLCEPCGLCKTYCIRTLSEIQARNVAHGQIIGLV